MSDESKQEEKEEKKDHCGCMHLLVAGFAVQQINIGMDLFNQVLHNLEVERLPEEDHAAKLTCRGCGNNAIIIIGTPQSLTFEETPSDDVGEEEPPKETVH